jgi:hemolysin activation/secretion protein
MRALLSATLSRPLLLLIGFAAPALALAQVLPSPTLPQIEAPAERKPLPALPEPALPELELPPAPPQVPADLDTDSRARVLVRHIVLDGNTVFSTEELRREVLARYEGRALSGDDIEALRRELTEHYVKRRYVNSGALIPDQDLAEGRLTVRIIEGRLTEVLVRGTTRLDPQYVRSRIALEAVGPLNAERLYHRLVLLQQDPRIAELHAELRPGASPGEAVLAVDVSEAGAHRLAVSYANNRSPVSGANRFEVFVADENLTGRGDVLAARLGWTGGLNDMRFSYALPLTPRETLLALRAERSRSTVIEQPFRELGIAGNIEGYAVSLVHPFVRRIEETVSAGLTLERRRSETFLFGEPFSFSPGVQDGVSVVTALRFSLEWIARDARSVLAARSTVSRGIGALGATRNVGPPDGRFIAWLGQAQWLYRWPNEVRALGRADVQLARDALLPIEKFPIGGAASVRGYRENQFVRDNGWAASLELRLPVARLPLAPVAAGDGQLELAPFVDWGRAWNRSEPHTSLASIGIGVHWTPARQLFLQAYKGFPLRRLERAGGSAQDRGIHFAIGLQLL